LVLRPGAPALSASKALLPSRARFFGAPIRTFTAADRE
jgi:hypothetical protein